MSSGGRRSSRRSTKSRSLLDRLYSPIDNFLGATGKAVGNVGRGASGVASKVIGTVRRVGSRVRNGASKTLRNVTSRRGRSRRGSRRGSRRN
jgi:hypothetical protein